MLVEQDLTLELLPNGGWDSRIEVIQVGDLVRSHLIYTKNFTVVYDTLLGPLSGGFLARRAAARGKSGVEVISNGLRPAHGHTGRQVGIHPTHPCTIRAIGQGVEMNYLRQGMHTRIGTTGTHYARRRIGDDGKRSLDGILHGTTIRLRLPATERGTVIFDAECVPHVSTAKSINPVLHSAVT